MIVEKAIEALGIPTILIATLPPVARQYGAPRSVAPDVPMGASLGKPHDRIMQKKILQDALLAFNSIEKPGEVLPLPYRYRK